MGNSEQPPEIIRGFIETTLKSSDLGLVDSVVQAPELETIAPPNEDSLPVRTESIRCSRVFVEARMAPAVPISEVWLPSKRHSSQRICETFRGLR